MAHIQRSVENGYLKETRAVHKKVRDLYGRKRAQRYFSYQIVPLTPRENHSLPPRRRGQRKPTLTFSFQYHRNLAEKDAKYDGLYVIATSLSRKTHTTDDVFIAFKEQHHIETAHHQWKAPICLRPVFLKKVTRIESLILVQFLALMAFYLLQRLYRLIKGASCRTTGETLLKRFAFCAIAVRYEKQSVTVSPFALNDNQAEILHKLGFPQIEEQIRRYVARRKKSSEEINGNDI